MTEGPDRPKAIRAFLRALLWIRATVLAKSMLEPSIFVRTQAMALLLHFFNIGDS